jgi:aminocarboxymuconate-semialdehyde decarboxylase
MLFTCKPRAAAAARPASRKVVKRGRKRLAVDLHCHIHTPAADDLARQATAPGVDQMARYGDPRTIAQQRKLRAALDRKLTSVDQRIADMDRMGIDVQAISTSPLQYYYATEPEIGRRTVDFVERAKALTRAQKDAIMGGNAAKLLKLKPRSS